MLIEFLEHGQLLASTLVPVAIDLRHLARVGSQVYIARPRSGGILGGFNLFLDRNGNAKLDAGEPTATTDDTRRYAFTGLSSGIYVVRGLSQPGWVVSGAGARRVRVRQNRVIVDVSFGHVADSAIAVTLFEDRNRDGKRQSNEPIVKDPAATTSLSNLVDLVYTPVDDKPLIGNDGRRTFHALEPARYSVVVGGAWERVEPDAPNPGNTPPPPTPSPLGDFDVELSYGEAEEILIGVQRA